MLNLVEFGLRSLPRESRISRRCINKYEIFICLEDISNLRFQGVKWTHLPSNKHWPKRLDNIPSKSTLPRIWGIIKLILTGTTTIWKKRHRLRNKNFWCCCIELNLSLSLKKLWTILTKEIAQPIPSKAAEFSVLFLYFFISLFLCFLFLNKLKCDIFPDLTAECILLERGWIIQ